MPEEGAIVSDATQLVRGTVSVWARWSLYDDGSMADSADQLEEIKDEVNEEVRFVIATVLPRLIENVQRRHDGLHLAVGCKGLD